MLGRALLRIPVRSRLLTPASQCQYDLVSNPAILSLARTYATPGRPKSVVGEPSRPVKRVVKKTATRGEPAAKATGAKKAKKKVAKKPVKKAVKKLTPEQKEKKKATADKTHLKELKNAALSPPNTPRSTAYVAFVSEKMPAKFGELRSSNNPDPAETRRALADSMRSLAAQWKSISASELEHYNHVAVQKKQASEAELKRWVESHSAGEILEANKARSQLRRKLETGQKGATKWPAIPDDRAVKRPMSGFSHFMSNRQASGDFKNIGVTERAKLISQEWKTLGEGEKQKYQRLFEQDRQRFATEFKDVYGYEAPRSKPRAAAAAA